MRLAEDLGATPVRYQGNWIPHRLRPAAEDGVFFVGDSAGHCLPLTAEGIRTALYFGIACGRELRAVVEGSRTRAQALARYGDVRQRTAGSSRRCCASSSSVPRVPPRGCSRAGLAAMRSRRFLDWAFGHYLEIAPPEFVAAAAPRQRWRAGRSSTQAA